MSSHTGKNLPPLTDHIFWANIRIQCNTTKSLAQIAAGLGVDVAELVAWIEAYREPTAPKQPLNAKYGPPIGQPKRIGNPWSPAEAVRRQSAWERAHAGAAEARKATA